MVMSHFDNIRVVLAEANPEVRADLTQGLLDCGFKDVMSIGNMSQVVSAVNAGEVDLLIADTSLPEGDFNEYVNELRHGRHGDNPFLVVITLVSSPSRDSVHAAINSGTDHVLAKPFDAATLVEKITEMTHARKRFVVTTDYIGPDRRSTHRPGTMQVAQIDVPNPLHQRMSGNASAVKSKRTIEAAKLNINEQKVQRHAYQIGWLLDHVLPEISAMKADALSDNPENLKKLCEVSRDLCRRIKGTRFAHVAEMSMTLSHMAERALKDGLCDDDMRLMGRMADIIERAFDPGREDAAAEYNRKARGRGINVFNRVEQQERKRKKTALDNTAPASVASG